MHVVLVGKDVMRKMGEGTRAEQSKDCGWRPSCQGEGLRLAYPLL